MSPMRRRLLCSLTLLAIALTLGGCGSKISEANYFRVQYGMDEEEIEDLLGPAHQESVEPRPAGDAPTSGPASTRPIGRKVKTWSRDGITIRVVFDDGLVTARSAEGIAAEPPASLPASRAASPEVSCLFDPAVTKV